VTVACNTESATARAFDTLAPRYDEVFTRSLVGRAQRDAVWDVLLDTFEPGSHLLELNCGTGEDALFLAQHDMSVVACDASEGMIRTAQQRMRREDPEAPIEFKLLATEYLWQLHSKELFDGAFSNFSGLNCVADLNQTAYVLSALLTRGAPVVICLSTRFCLWEMVWFSLRGQFRKAFRRCSGFATAQMGSFTVKVHYPTLRAVRRSFSSFFHMRSCMGIGVAVPPSYMEPLVRRYPRFLGWLSRIDKFICRLPGFRTLGDHMLIHFERIDPCC
jgi:SAM-dependent methyltransferase